MVGSTVCWMVEWWAVAMDGKMVGMMVFLSAVWMAELMESSKADLKVDEMVQLMADSTVCLMVEWWAVVMVGKMVGMRVVLSAVWMALWLGSSKADL